MDDFVDVLLKTVLPIVAIIAGIGIIIAYIVFLNRKINRTGDTNDESQSNSETKSLGIKSARVINFIDSKVMSFYEALKNALPRNYIVFPNVSIELLFGAGQRSELKCLGQYADFVVFTEKFAPALVIDLKDHFLTGELSDGISFKIKDNVKEVIRNSGLAVLEYDLRETYSVDDLRRAIARIMNPLRQ